MARFNPHADAKFTDLRGYLERMVVEARYWRGTSAAFSGGDMMWSFKDDVLPILRAVTQSRVMNFAASQFTARMLQCLWQPANGTTAPCEYLHTHAMRCVREALGDASAPADFCANATHAIATLLFEMVAKRHSDEFDASNMTMVESAARELAERSSGTPRNQRAAIDRLVSYLKVDLPKAAPSSSTASSAGAMEAAASTRRSVQERRADDEAEKWLPGAPSAEGEMRHSNDHAEIRSITCIPTTDELLCPHEPYLPRSGPGAWHHLSGPAKLLDTQFRFVIDNTCVPWCPLSAVDSPLPHTPCSDC